MECGREYRDFPVFPAAFLYPIKKSLSHPIKNLLKFLKKDNTFGFPFVFHMKQDKDRKAGCAALPAVGGRRKADG